MLITSKNKRVGCSQLAGSLDVQFTFSFRKWPLDSRTYFCWAFLPPRRSNTERMVWPLLNMVIHIDANMSVLCNHSHIFISLPLLVHREDIRKQWSVLGTFLCPRAINTGTAGCSPHTLTRSLATIFNDSWSNLIVYFGEPSRFCLCL